MSNHPLTINIVRRSALLEILAVLLIGPYVLLWWMLKYTFLGIYWAAVGIGRTLDLVLDETAAHRARRTATTARRPVSQAHWSNRR